MPGSPFFLDGLTNGGTYYVSIQAQDSRAIFSDRRPGDRDDDERQHPERAHRLHDLDESGPITSRCRAPVTTKHHEPCPTRTHWPRVLRSRRLQAVLGISKAGSPGYDLLASPTRACSPRAQPPVPRHPARRLPDRWYVMTVDTCGNESYPTPASKGRLADAGVKPTAPASCRRTSSRPRQGRAGQAEADHAQDVTGKDIKIERYEVYRSAPIDGAARRLRPSGIRHRLAVVYTNTYVDTAVPLRAGGLFTTGSWAETATTIPTSRRRLPECAFQRGRRLRRRRTDKVSRARFTTVTVTSGTDTYILVSITYVHSTKGPQRTFTPSRRRPRAGPITAGTPCPHGSTRSRATVTNSPAAWKRRRSSSPPRLPQTGP